MYKKTGQQIFFDFIQHLVLCYLSAISLFLAMEHLFEIIEARVPQEMVWQAWEKAHAFNGQERIEAGQKGWTAAPTRAGFPYKIMEVTPGQSFTILLKRLFIRLNFTHSLCPHPLRSEIRY